MKKKNTKQLWKLSLEKIKKNLRRHKTQSFNLLLISLCFCGALQGQPIDNPVLSYYNGAEGYPTWTNDIKWNNVINMATYNNGTNNFEKFENARDQLYSQGGGVLYYPAGTYTFTITDHGPSGRGLMLKSGVVIRGDAPTGDKVAVDDGKMDLLTKFRFTYSTTSVTTDGNSATVEFPGMWNLIGITPSGTEQLKDVKNVGIAWVDLDGAVIYFGLQLNWAATWLNSPWLGPQSVGPWASRAADGTHPMDPFHGYAANTPYVGAGSGRLVFGCQLNNAAATNNRTTRYSATVGGTPYESTPIFADRFAPRMGVYGSDVFIANNAIPKPTRAFRYQTTVRYRKNATPYNVAPHAQTENILFDYGDQLGIDVNKSLIGTVISSQRRNFANSPYYENNIVVNDNYVYNHGHKGYEISGEWVTIKNNKNIRDFLRTGDNVYGVGSNWVLTMEGWDASYETDDNMSRAFDLNGKSLWVDNNYFNNVGSDPGNDGEGILAQQHNDIDVFSWALTNNTKGPNGDNSYMGTWSCNIFGMLIFKNTITSGAVGALAFTPPLFSLSIASNNAKSIATDGVKFDVTTTCPSSAPSAPANVIATYNATKKCIVVTWTDNTENEIGYRIDRRVTEAGEWKTICYRPKVSNTHPINVSNYNYTNETDVNRPEFYDYTLGNAAGAEYRVAAIDCNDDSNASAISNKVSFNAFPVVNITSPANDSMFLVGANFTITATATDSDGSISNVEFYNGANKLGEDSISPYTYTWNNAAAGSYNLTAKATDNEGAVTISSVIAITVGNVFPKVAITSPTNNVTFKPGVIITIDATASDRDGTVSKVEFYRDSVKLGEDTSSPYSFVWNNAPIGNYKLTARATDNEGAVTISTDVAITVGNALPSVNITAPTNNAQFTAGANITINADASDSDGSIIKVEFYQGSSKIGESTTSPYSFVWNNVLAGTYPLTAKAIDDEDGVSSSATINIVVNALPSVSITLPVNNATSIASQAITINASASDSDGSVAKVEFYQGATKLGEDLTSPYSYTWNNVLAGNYALTAKASDNKGAVNVSDSIIITVNPLPTDYTNTVTVNQKINGGVWNSLGAFRLTEGSLNSVKIRTTNTNGYVIADAVKFTKEGEADIIVDNANGSGILIDGVWTPGSNPSFYGTNYIHDGNTGKDTKSVTFVPTIPQAGTWNIYMMWSANANRADNVPVDVCVPNIAPTANITSPLNNATFTTDNTITISADASDSDGNVTKVEFFQGSSKLGEDTSSPYSFDWTNVAPGTYSLTAKATDDKGASTTSAAISIVVNQAITCNTVVVNQKINGSVWNSLGSFTLTAGTTNTVKINTTNTNGYVIADAVKFSKNGQSDIIIDNASGSGVTIEGVWTSGANPGYYGVNYIHDGNTGKGTKSVTFTPNIPVDGTWQISMRWVASSNRANNIPVDICSGGSQLKSVTVAANFITSESGLKLKVYPNPATDVLTIEGDSEENTTIQVITASGKTLLIEKHSGKFTKTLNISEWPSGIYILKAVSGGRVEEKKIVLTK